MLRRTFGFVYRAFFDFAQICASYNAYGVGNAPMDFYIPRPHFLEFFLADAVRQYSALMFSEMVEVGIPEYGEYRPGKQAERKRRLHPGDLKIYEITFAVIADNDVVRFVGVQVSHAALVHGFQQRLKLREEIIAHLGSFVKVAARHIFMHESGTSVTSDPFRHMAGIL